MPGCGLDVPGPAMVYNFDCPEDGSVIGMPHSSQKPAHHESRWQRAMLIAQGTAVMEIDLQIYHHSLVPSQNVRHGSVAFESRPVSQVCFKPLRPTWHMKTPPAHVGEDPRNSSSGALQGCGHYWSSYQPVPGRIKRILGNARSKSPVGDLTNIRLELLDKHGGRYSSPSGR
jgi:hypothetical protein